MRVYFRMLYRMTACGKRCSDIRMALPSYCSAAETTFRVDANTSHSMFTHVDLGRKFVCMCIVRSALSWLYTSKQQRTHLVNVETDAKPFVRSYNAMQTCRCIHIEYVRRHSHRSFEDANSIISLHCGWLWLFWPTYARQQSNNIFFMESVFAHLCMASKYARMHACSVNI